MKAIVYDRYGGPEMLRLREIVRPEPADDEVLVKVRAASLNDWDWGLLHGDFINRLINGLLKPKRNILGSDISGIVEAVGNGVKQFKPGDEVYGDLSGRWGGFAEYAFAPEKCLALKPASMSFEEAAAMPQAAMLAVQGLIDKGNIQCGQSILVNGAGGGVGTFAIQIAKLYDADVTGVDHTDKLDMLRFMGFDEVIDYTKDDFTRQERQYDLVLDVKTSRSVFDCLRAVRPGGTYVTLGGSAGRLIQALLIKPWVARISKKNILIVALKPNKDLLYINQLFEERKICAVIEGPYPLGDVPGAFRVFGESAHKGKIVVVM